MPMSMVDLLTMMMREAGGPRNAQLRKTCKEALEILKSEETVKAIEPHELRARCLVPLQLAVESRSVRLAQHALVGIQRLLVENQFQTVMETEDETKWLPMQILEAVWWTPNLPDDLQVEVMKIILNMTFSTNWSMNAKVITKITELSFSIFLTTSKPSLRRFIAKALTQILSVFHRKKGASQANKPNSWLKQSPESESGDSSSQLSADVYGTSSQASVRTAVKATLTQLLSVVAGKLSEKSALLEKDPDDVIADFTNDATADLFSLSKDVIEILRFLCTKLREATSPSSRRHPEPLLLEGILTIISNVPIKLTETPEFTDLIWQDLCPSLVVLLGNPLHDKSITSQKAGSQEEMGRGSGCSSSAPNVTAECAKIIYCIAMELVRLVGTMQSMRPVLESLFHRMLLYPPPVHRHEALKAVKEIVSSPQRLMDLAGPTLTEREKEQTSQQTFTNTKRRRYTDIALLKLVIDAVQECCHCSDSSVCITSIELVDNLLTSIEKLAQGEGLTDQMITEIHRQYREVESTYNGITYVSTVLVPEYITDENTERTTVVKYTDMTSSQSSLSDSDSDYGPQGSDSEGDSSGEAEKERMFRVKRMNEESVLNQQDDNGQNTEEKHQRAPPLLHDNEDESKTFRPLNMSDFEVIEKRSAGQYIAKLRAFIPKLLAAFSNEEVDRLMQDFSSLVCSELCANPSKGEDMLSAAILNADGVYMATYSALLLNLKLVRCGYYISDEKSLPISEKQFIDDILGCGLLLYLSPAWLREVYRQVIETDFLTQCGYIDSIDDSHIALVQVLTDIDGLGSRKIGGQFLCGFRDAVATPSAYEKSRNRNPVSALAGMKFARRILQACWEGMLDVLSVLLSGRGSCGITSSIALLLGGKDEGRRAREAICTALNGLQKAARLSCVLGLQDRCGGVFAQLAGASSILEELRREERRQTNTKGTSGVADKLRSAKPVRIHSAQALSLDVVLSIGLEMGSHSTDCWKHVLSCCAHVSELEHVFFSQGQNQTNLPKVQQEQHQVDVNTSHYAQDEAELYGTMVISTEPVAPSINVSELIRETSEEGGWEGGGAKGEILPAPQAAKVLCGLSQAVDRMFEDAANQLNMKALVGFLTELCHATKLQLSSYGSAVSKVDMPTNCLHLYRLGDILMRCLRSERPLLHLMTAWSVVAPYLVEAACHRDRTISKKAVDTIHEFVTTLLSQRQEPPHSHFNESLCKPFENLLCLELCDGDVQDQVVCSICELVETCTSEIKSGWRPLFGALRAVKIEYTTVEEVNEARQRHIAAVLDVFNVFLNTDNSMVFANAAVDCILCLLKYVKGPGGFEEPPEDDDSDSGSELDKGSEDLCLPALKYLQQCCSLLSSMWDMPKCPTFTGAHRIRSTATPRCVDATIPNMDLDAFQKPWINETFIGRKMSTSESWPQVQTPQPRMKPRPEDQGNQNADSTSLDSGIGVINSDGSAAQSQQTSPDKEEDKTGDPESAQVDNNKGEESEPEHKPNDAEETENTDAKDANTEPPGGETKEEAHSEELDNESQPTANTEDQREENKASSHETPKLADQTLSMPKAGGPDELQLLTLEELDNHTGVLHVWFLVLEGLATTASTAPRNYQPQTLEMLFNLLRSAAQVPGPAFSLHCVNHLLLPMLQSWLRRGNQITGFWEVSAANFKQCCGLCTDLVVEFIVQFAGNTESQASVVFMLKQLLDVLIECVAQPNESLSRLGCACIRHCLQSTGNLLTEPMWHVAVTAITRAVDVTLYCLRQLMTPFHEDSDNFYGDIGHVKVAVRKDCSGIECERLRQLAQQVLLLDAQRGTSSMIDYEAEEDRSYIFLIYPPNHDRTDNPELNVTRVPFRSIVVGLLSHQLLIQMVGTLLLQGSQHMVPVERSLLAANLDPDTPQEEDPDDLIQDAPLPGMLKHLSTRNVLVLAQCLLSSYRTAAAFDDRPGLKFLMQKVSRASVAANLYKQAGISLTLYIHTLLEICAHQDNIHVDHTQKVLSSVASRDMSGYVSCPTAGFLLQPPVLTADFVAAVTSTEVLQVHMAVFIRTLKAIFDEVCTRYVDLYLDQEGPSKADKLSTQMLVFLLAEPEELPQLKREKPLSEMVREKLEAQREATKAASALTSPIGSTFSPVIAVQETEQYDPYGPLDTTPTDTPATTSSPSSPKKDGPKRTQADKVYTVATDKTIKSLMSEYKKRKQAHSMPTFVRAQRSKPAKSKVRKSRSADPIDREIEEQQVSSIMKDSEAHLSSWIEMLVSVLSLFHQLPDFQYRALLPAIFSCVNQLICHCKDSRLREALAQWVYRIGHMYGMAPHDDPLPVCR